MDLLKYACALMLAGCFSPSLDGKYACGPGESCPPGLTCIDSICSDSPRLTTSTMSGGEADLATRHLAMSDLGTLPNDLSIESPDLAPAPHDLASVLTDAAGADLSCHPRVCGTGQCGEALDGCGGTINCPGCNGMRKCGVGGPNLCGKGTCTARTCQELGATCGLVSDGCSKVLFCGVCGPTP